MPIVINGREGVGKTSICLQAAKEIRADNPNTVIYWFSTEGTVADTYIKAMQLELPEDGFLIAAKSEGDFLFNFKNFKERQLLDTLLSEAPAPPIAVFIDSIRGMTSQSVNDEDVGNTMRQLNAIVCDKHQAALIYLHHWNKRESDNLLDRNTGTTAITAAARLVLSVLPASKYVRKIVVTKSNLADEIPTLEVVKQGDSLSISEIEIPDETQTDQAESFLIEQFSANPKLYARDIYQAGEEQGLSSQSLKRAKTKLGIKSVREDFGWIWKWRTP
jgi:archaellum biogenesis ATPase FlaH